MDSYPVALVTGSSRGIGRATAEELARRGYAIVVNFVKNAQAATDVVAGIRAGGGQAISVQADVAVASDRLRLMNSALEHFQRLDLLVNNAGITSPGRRDVLEATESAWDEVFATNLKGPFFLAQQVALRMIELIQSGRIPRATIINVSSISAYAVSTNRADYCLAKAALPMMTWLLATRLANENIQVFEVCPGVIASDMTASVHDKYVMLISEGLSPIRRFGRPDDVASAIAALASGAFPFSTGDRINVDGGFHIRRL